MVFLSRSVAVVFLLASWGCGGGSSNSSKDAAFDVLGTGGRAGSGGLTGSASGGLSGTASGGLSGTASGGASVDASAPGSGGSAASTGGTSGNVDAGAEAALPDASLNGDGPGRDVVGSSAGGAGAETGGTSGAAGGNAGGGASGAGGRTGAASGGAGGGPYVGGGSGASGGAGGNGGGCFPACLDALVQSCPTTGSCTYAISLSPIGANVCFSNGVKAQNVTAPLTTSTVKNANGNPCYTLETTIGNAGVGYLWKNPAGTTVATATVASATMDTMTVMCNGSTTVVDLNAPGCSGQSTQPATTNCTLGTCAF